MCNRILSFNLKSRNMTNSEPSLPPRSTRYGTLPCRQVKFQKIRDREFSHKISVAIKTIIEERNLSLSKTYFAFHISRFTGSNSGKTSRPSSIMDHNLLAYSDLQAFGKQSFNV